MTDRESRLLDTNILIRLSLPGDPRHFEIGAALEKLERRNCALFLTSRILGELWNVCTRPIERNGLGFSSTVTNEIVQAIEDRFQLLPASDEVHIKWRSLPVKHEVKGVQVHDARFAATMYIHKILRILTNNTRDFKRYSGLETITPQEVIAGVV